MDLDAFHWVEQLLTAVGTAKYRLHEQSMFSDIRELFFIIQVDTVGLRKMYEVRTKLNVRSHATRGPRVENP
jgi:hypothetical protein